MSKHEEKLKRAITEVLGEMNELSDEDIQIELAKYRNSELASLLLAANDMGYDTGSTPIKLDHRYASQRTLMPRIPLETMSVRVGWDELLVEGKRIQTDPVYAKTGRETGEYLGSDATDDYCPYSIAA